MKCKRCDSVPRKAARYCDACGSLLVGEDWIGRLAHAHQDEVAGRLDGAAAQYESLLSEVGAAAESAVVRKHLGNLRFRLGHLRAARVQMTRACELDAGNGTFWHDLGVVDYHLADFDGAVSAFRRALDADPNLHLTLFWLGNALYHRGDHEEAARTFGELIERYPNFAIARFHLGVTHARQGLQKLAQEQFRKLLMHNPEDVAARYYVANSGPAPGLLTAEPPG